jgi:7-cyano-7-deazaguanine synthase
MKSKAVVVYSGGMDSYTVLHLALQQNYEVYALSFNYGQRHDKELVVAAWVCEDLGLPHKVVDISAINQLLQGSSLTDKALQIPTGDYHIDNMKSTVVPNRNMILLSLAVGYAVSIGAGKVFYGAHAGDHTIYPDCRPEFVAAMNEVSTIANYEPVEIISPFLHASKIEILQLGLAMGLDYAHSWTCYNGRAKACGQCSSCRERLAAFAAQDMVDPLDYEAPVTQRTL